MRIIYVKNLTNESKDWGTGRTFSPNEEYLIPDEIRLKNYTERSSFLNVLNSEAQVGDGSKYFSDLNDQINWLKGHLIQINKQTPFAEPEYRTKLKKTGPIIINPDSVNELSLLMTEELYVYGGDIIVEGNEIGDYLEAYVEDSDGVIPADYRDSLCENYPIVNSYLDIYMPKSGEYKLDTRPLIAKISAGLYLKIKYHAINSGNNRTAYGNYFMLKKL